MLRRFLKLRQIVKSYQPDAVVSFHPQVNIAAILATRGLGLRTVVVAERTYPPAIVIGRIWVILRRLLYSHATQVVMQTEQGLKWLEKESPASRGCVIPNPCIFPLPQYEPMLLPREVLGKDRLVILSVGRLSEEKGFVKAIKAFAKLAEAFTKWDFVIIGEGPERPILEQLILNLGLQDRVYLPGRIGNLGIWYDRADVYLLSSRFEGFPNALMEAMAHGIPVVSFNCDTGPSDLIQDGVDGYLIPPSEGVCGLVKKLEVLMSDLVLREKVGEQAKYVRNKFSMECVGIKWDSVLAPES
jgi:glycosyltransferase involved in cell wall biosynthesis